MKLLSIICLFCFSFLGSNAQDHKPPLDRATFHNWPFLAEGQGITDDGKYVFYKLQNEWSGKTTLVLQQLGGSWMQQLNNAEQVQFTLDSRYVLFMQGKDSLCLFSLGSDNKEYIPDVTSFKLFSRADSEWLLYKTGKKLVMRRVAGKETSASYDNVLQYQLADNGESMVLVQDPDEKTHVHSEVSWVDLSSNRTTSIWQGSGVDQLVLDRTGKQLVFASDRPNRLGEKSFWFYREGAKEAELLLQGSYFKEDTSLMIDQVSGFTTDNSGIVVLLKEKHKRVADPENVKVDVWSYKDPIIQSKQLFQLDPIWGEKTYRAVIRISDRSTWFWQRRDMQVDGVISDAREGDDLVVLDNNKGDVNERYWFTNAKPSYDVISLKNGKTNHISFRYFGTSPNGRFMTGYIAEGEFEVLCCYGRTTGKLYNIAASIPVPKELDLELQPSKFIWGATWIPGNDTSLLVFDKYDVWVVDPEGIRKPVNLTNGYGRRNNMELRLPDNGIIYLKNNKGETDLLLSVFDLTNKNSGFSSISLKGPNDPKILSLGAFDYKPGFFGPYVIKAKDASVFMVRRASCTESVNWFSTSDFKYFNAISDVHPEKDYNWMRSELITFNTTDGRKTQAVIYKPEDFDASKKYPVILHYYEEKSNNLNKYQTIYGNDAMDFSIAWYVSHGYIVVTPDIINYKAGNNGETAVQTVLGVTAYLEKLPWIDINHIGLQGESYGGFETNYIITRTHRFAAAISSSGFADDIGGYANVISQEYWENRQGRMAGSLWQHPEYYIKNSPILEAHNITTPILTIANKNDGNVPFAQGLEWYMGLRRLGKKIWMLQYYEGGHGLDGKQLEDFILRSQQFYDFYLKGMPAPIWMIEGIPVARKGIDNGMELEAPGVVPGPGLLTPEEQKKVDAMQKRKAITVTIGK